MEAVNRERHPMERLKRRLGAIAEIVPPGSQVAYIDYPLHENIGDLLILQGTEAFFAEHRIRVRRRYSCVNFRPGVKLPRDWILVCHGGGNFGDLYPWYQRLREDIVRAYPDHRIVILPQTVEFRDAESERRSLELLGSHKDLHLFVRDRVSYEKARGRIANLYLSPDMAHQLYPIDAGQAGQASQASQADQTGQAGRAGSARVLGVLRTDGEASGAESTAIEGERIDEATDWPLLLSAGDRLAVRLLVAMSSLDRRLRNALPVWPLWRRFARRLTNKAIRKYAVSGRVVTSRLHGHILACLMNKPNVLLDNSYGKNVRYYREWTREVDGATAVLPRTGAGSGEEEAVRERVAGIDYRDLHAQPS